MDPEIKAIKAMLSCPLGITTCPHCKESMEVVASAIEGYWPIDTDDIEIFYCADCDYEGEVV